MPLCSIKKNNAVIMKHFPKFRILPILIILGTMKCILSIKCSLTAIGQSTVLNCKLTKYLAKRDNASTKKYLPMMKTQMAY